MLRLTRRNARGSWNRVCGSSPVLSHVLTSQGRGYPRETGLDGQQTGMLGQREVAAVDGTPAAVAAATLAPARTVIEPPGATASPTRREPKATQLTAVELVAPSYPPNTFHHSPRVRTRRSAPHRDNGIFAPEGLRQGLLARILSALGSWRPIRDAYRTLDRPSSPSAPRLH